MIFVAVDIGGTFTDLIGFDEEAGVFLQAKSLTTPAELTQGVIDCLKQSGVKAAATPAGGGDGRTGCRTPAGCRGR